MATTQFIRESAVKKFIRDTHRNPRVRVSQELLTALDGRIRVLVESAVRLPSNNKTVRELHTTTGR